ncbi:hypothetical protein J2046_000242 [Rhizobium petrolearium]|uniref:helix-turn-helix domain-containing protein n=1 Tax=Neorhizobium petrolearium TaxID=515361 RepID=UPI001AE9754F|nr:helix-turn-helix domain-containing protein [Neorhizobium petrolearium]MBP1841998.1 hypothetical protein [Neorhizobium petrolearium]
MSHEATMWAVKIRGISCTEARVLWHLADCHNPIYGCYPKQDYLADACEIDERSVRRSLASLRDKGLINWTEAREGKNRKANRYSLAFEPGFRRAEPEGIPENQPDNLSGSTDASTGQDCTLEPDSGGALNRTPESSIEPVREPVIEPVNSREGAREPDGEDRKAIERAFWRTIKDWPGFAGMPKEQAKREWFNLTADERERAERRRDAWFAMLKAQRKSHVPAPSTYFREKLFDDVAEPKPEAAAPQMHNAMSRPWMALLLSEVSKPMATAWPALTSFQQMQMRDADKAREIERERRAKYGWPKAAAMAADMKPSLVPAHLLPHSEGFSAVHRDSGTAARWQAMFERHGWPWPSTKFDWLYLPPGEPEDAMAEFRMRLNEGKGNDDAA